MANDEASPTLIGLLSKAAQSYPEKRAIFFAGKFEISHSRLQELVDYSASVLQSAGISTGDVVALAIPNSIELAIMILAVMWIRGVAAPLNPVFTEEEFELYLSESKLLLTDSNGNPSAQAAASKLGITQVIVSLPDPTGPVHISVPNPNGDSTHDLVHDFSNDPSDVALLLHTSGTTSRPKVVPLTQQNLAASVQNIASMNGMTATDSFVVGMPLYHEHGLVVGLLSTLSTGGSVILPAFSSFSASSLLDEDGYLQLVGPTGPVHISVPTLNGDSTHDLVGGVNELINDGGTAGGNTDSPISAPAAAVDIALDMEALMPTLVDSPLNNIETTQGFEISLSEGPEQNTGSPGGGLGPNRTNWIQWSGAVDAFNSVSDATLGVTVNLPNLFMNRSNSIRQLVFLAGANLLSNTLVAVNYLYGEAQEAHERNWRAELIASVGAPIAVSAFTLLSSFRFASDPERWSNWIAELSRVNAAMIGGGPLAFYWMSHGGTET